MRSIALFACLAACSSNDDPTLRVDFEGDQLLVAVVRAPDHSFGHVTATINGLDAGTVDITPGHQPGWNTSPFADQPYGATASFLTPIAQIGASLHVEIDDDGDRYVLDVPDFGTPRTPTVVTPLDQPLHPNDWIEVTTGVASDRIGDGMSGKVNGRYCFTQWATDVGVGSTKFELPPNFTTSWTCDPAPTAGTPLAIELDIAVEVSPLIAKCSGPGLSCDPIDLFLPDVMVPATVEP
jgi:hypothetical protein